MADDNGMVAPPPLPNFAGTKVPPSGVTEIAGKDEERARRAKELQRRVTVTKSGYVGSSYDGSARTIDHVGAFNFRIEIEGLDCGGFKSVGGLEIKVAPITYYVSNERLPRKRPGRPTVTDLKFRKGYVNTDTLWRWCEEVMNGTIQRKCGSVVLLDDAGVEGCRYNFYEAWPTRWSGFKLDGKSNDVMVEELDLAIERLVRD